MELRVPATEQFQAIVIGSGQAGTPLSRALAKAGLKTALIEREHVGGTCINEGCTPTKTMVASARVAYLARRACDYGIHADEVRVDMARVRQRKRDVVTSFRAGSEQRIARTPNLELIVGDAAFTGPKSLRIAMKGGGQRSLAADMMFINTGCRPSVPALEGLSTVPFLDSTSIMELDVIPEHLLILGGGYVGVEFAQMFRRFGSRVTMVVRGGQLLSHEDDDVAREVAAILEQDGVRLLFNTEASGVAQVDSRIRLAIGTGVSDIALDGSHLLVATGRTPNSDAMNLSAAGVTTDPRGFVRVNGRLETSQAGVFAMGDVKGGPAFTHISYDDFRVLRTNLIEKNGRTATTEGRLVPYTVYMDPELGRVGLGEAEARTQGRRIRVARLPLKSVARALEVDEARGFMKAIIDADTGLILGAVVLGIEGGEIMSMLELAIMGKLHYTALRDGIFAHPTLAESLNNLFTHVDP
ncbi:MAG TPA: mercuric reductase [Gemmatimonadaceae bacterium]|nr:mercuric reductase [Gemmatimonadaceae bacterium]